MPAGIGRTLGLPSAVSFIVGIVIGSGIFASPGFVVEGVGSPGAALLVWACCGAFSLAGALTYAELGAMFPVSGGEAVYLPRAFPGVPGLSFMYVWVTGGLAKPAGGAAIAVVCGDYLSRLWYDDLDDAPKYARKGVSIAVIVVIAVSQLLSTRVAAATQVVSTQLKLLLVFALVVMGVVEVSRGGPYASQLSHHKSFGSGEYHDGTSSDMGDWVTAVTKCLFAYNGWNNLMLAAGEVREPYRTIPLAAGVGLSLVTVAYVFLNAAYLIALPVTDHLKADNTTQPGISGEETVAIEFSKAVAGHAVSVVITVGVAISALGAYNGSLFGASRLVHSAGKDGVLPRAFGWELAYGGTLATDSTIDVASQRRTPAAATLLVAGVAITLILVLGSFSTIVDVYTWWQWIFYGATGVGMLVLRVREPSRNRPFRAPLIAPLMFIAAAVYVCVFLFIDKPVESGCAAGVLVLGVPVFFLLRRCGLVDDPEPPGTNADAALREAEQMRLCAEGPAAKAAASLGDSAPWISGPVPGVDAVGQADIRP